MLLLTVQAETISELKSKTLAILEEYEPRVIEGEVIASDVATTATPKRTRTRKSSDPAAGNVAQVGTPEAQSTAPAAPVAGVTAPNAEPPAAPQSESGASAAAATPPAGSAPKPPSLGDALDAGKRYLEKHAETYNNCPKFMELLLGYGVRQVSALPEEKRAEFIAKCDA